ncbi:hypothetical protein Goshw_011005 [Gossypium schwendimanii]|uniref:Leucine-rich repeat-containing N-terminal plant-type domain-containing protein n=1 Tax=Gossypium schwendimanii TaxID=34291 RepID=A0A7J9M3E0_GOSSC|nr:hypothetical protein [Gossypium schwendimanii]
MFFPKPIAFLLSVLLSFIWLRTNELDAATLPQNEVDVLNRIAKRWEVTTGISMPAVAMSRIKWTWVPRKTLPALARTTPATLRICKDLEANQFSGQVPPEIGKLVNLRTLRLSYNRLTGDLPVQLAELKNLTDFSGFTEEGKKLHGNILKMSFSSEHFLSEKLMDTYIALGDLNGVIKVFDAMPKWKVFSWNKMISAS